MTRLELLAGQLDAEALDHEKQAPQQIFSQGMDFWQLCLEAKRLVMEQKTVTPKVEAINPIYKEAGKR